MLKNKQTNEKKHTKSHVFIDIDKDFHFFNMLLPPFFFAALFRMNEVLLVLIFPICIVL